MKKKSTCASCKNGCMRCMPKGHVELMTMLLVVVFGLVTVMTIANFRMRAQQEIIVQQAQQIESLK
ncbi:TPA: hypothetical protein DEB00_03000 [Candidatus Uhrbacteria bacterium]|nr:hypothetical protein [Candidatus Uhrbacteria bacterium]